MFSASAAVRGIVTKPWDKILKNLDPYLSRMSPKSGVVYPTFLEEGNHHVNTRGMMINTSSKISVHSRLPPDLFPSLFSPAERVFPSHPCRTVAQSPTG